MDGYFALDVETMRGRKKRMAFVPSSLDSQYVKSVSSIGELQRISQASGVGTKTTKCWEVPHL
jgi:hypothetical protein